MLTKRFALDVIERALSTAAATFGSLVGSDSLNLLDMPLTDAAKAAAGAGLLVIVKSVAARRVPIGDASPSLVNLDRVGP